MDLPMWKYLALLALVGAAAAGGWAKHVTAKAADAAHESQACRSELAEHQRLRDEERAAKEKALSEASASLNASRTELDGLRVEHADAEKRLAALNALTEKFRKMIESGKLQVVLRHGRMVVKLPASVLFASGSADLSKEGKEALREVGVILRQVSDRRFMVAGHTDNVPVVPPSPFKTNLELSTARALIVAQQLAASGVARARLVPAGYAEFEPVRENSTEPGRQENRRIEIVLLPNLTELPGEHADGGAPAASAARDAGAADASTTQDGGAHKTGP